MTFRLEYFQTLMCKDFVHTDIDTHISLLQMVTLTEMLPLSSLCVQDIGHPWLSIHPPSIHSSICPSTTREQQVLTSRTPEFTAVGAGLPGAEDADLSPRPTAPQEGHPFLMQQKPGLSG